MNPKVHGPASVSPINWLGFICRAGARRLSWAQRGKLIAASVTNGHILSSEWRDLTKDQYVLCMLVLVADGKYGAFGVVDNDSWPIVISENGPRLTIVSEKRQPSVRPFLRKAV
jgi:hypothetical protein